MWSAPAGRKSANNESAARSRRLATRMSCSCSVSSPRRVPGSFASKAAKCRRSTAIGDGADGRVGVDRRLSEAPRLRRAEAGRQEAGLVFAQPGGLKAALGPQPFDERLERPHRAFRNLDLDPAQPCRPAAARGLDRRLVERDLARRGPVGLDGEETPVSSDLEQGKQALPAGKRAYPLTDRAVGTQEGTEIGLGKFLGDLASVAQPGHLRVGLVECLERRLSGRIASPAGATDPKRITGLVEASIVRVEIEIDLIASSSGGDAHGPRLGPPSLGIGQPAHHRPQINRIELPFDLATIHFMSVSPSATRPRTREIKYRIATGPSAEIDRRGSPSPPTEPRNPPKNDGEAAFFGGKLTRAFPSSSIGRASGC